MSVSKTEATLKVNGNSLPLEAQQILSLTSSKEVNKIPIARILLKDGEVDKQDFKISNRDYFIPGAKVQIELGNPNNKSVVFEGIVIKHSIKIRKNKPSVLMVECKDETVKLTIGRKSRYFSDISDSDIFQEILNGYTDLSLNVEDSNDIVLHEQLVQYFTTDWDFLVMRAEALGKYVFINDGEVQIHAPKLSEEAITKLSYGEPSDSQVRSRIWEFESEMDARYQFETITTSSWDSTQQNLVEGNNSFSSQEPGNLTSGDLSQVIGVADYKLHHLGRMLEGELSAYADAVKQKSILNKSLGRVMIDGRADILPGHMIELEGVGDRFNGKVFVSRVQHKFEPGRWFTEIQFGLPYTWFYEKNFISNPPALGLVPAISGLQIGKVVQLKDEGNPDKNFRIKVNIPGQHANDEGVWARVGSPFGGEQGGLVFLPNLEDEVIIGYIDQDAREPVVLGSLYSEAYPPPLENDDNNFLKGLVTNNKHKILIDEEKNVMTLEMAGGAKVELDDQNATLTLSIGQSSVEMNSGEIQIKATSIKLEAQTVDIKGNAAAQINSPAGGMVKLGNGVVPAAGVGTPVSPTPGSAVLQGPNSRVLI